MSDANGHKGVRRGIIALGFRHGAVMGNGTSRLTGFLFAVVVLAMSLDARADANVIVDGGFENGTAFWTETSSAGFPIITQNADFAHTGSGYAWLADYESAHDVLHQDVTIPADVEGAKLRFWYNIQTFEPVENGALDLMSIVITNPGSGAVLATIASFTNLNSTNGWLL